MRTERDLKGKGLDIHPGKTQYVYMDEGEQEVETGGKKVKGSLRGTLTVLGTPIAMENEISKIAAEIARRGRKAYWAHGKMFRGAGAMKDKIQAYGKLVTPAAGTYHPSESLLRAADTVQLPTQHAQAGTQARRSLGRVECSHPPDGEGAPGQTSTKKMERENSGPGVAPVGAHGKEGRASSAGDSVERASMVERSATRQARLEAPRQVQPQPGNGEDGDCNRRRDVRWRQAAWKAQPRHHNSGRRGSAMSMATRIADKILAMGIQNNHVERYYQDRTSRTRIKGESEMIREKYNSEPYYK